VQGARADVVCTDARSAGYRQCARRSESPGSLSLICSATLTARLPRDENSARLVRTRDQRTGACLTGIRKPCPNAVAGAFARVRISLRSRPRRASRRASITTGCAFQRGSGWSEADRIGRALPACDVRHLSAAPSFLSRKFSQSRLLDPAGKEPIERYRNRAKGLPSSVANKLFHSGSAAGDREHEQGARALVGHLFEFLRHIAPAMCGRWITRVEIL
jgi:hypothetical protein